MSGDSLLVMQGGGPTPVINACLGAVIKEAQNRGGFRRILGVRDGTAGLVRRDFIDLSQLSGETIGLLGITPGAFLGSSRYRPTHEEWMQIEEGLGANHVGGLILMGGNGTMRAAHRLCQSALSGKIQIVGVPATVDNDVMGTDRCPGYASAARFVAQSVGEVAMDVQSLPLPVTIFETMGRDSGWLAGAAWLARHEVNPAPHQVYLPEFPFDLGDFLGSIRRSVDEQGWAMAVVSEGIRDRNGDFIYRTGDPSQKDQGGQQLPGDVACFLAGKVTGALLFRCRSEKPGLCGRTSMSHVSSVDRRDAEVVGRDAVRSIRRDESGCMIGLEPLTPGEAPKTVSVPLEVVVEKERPVPEAWTGTPVEPSPDFLHYLRPLIEEPGLPTYAQKVQ